MTRSKTLIAFALAVSLAVAGCGEDDDDAPAAKQPTATATAQPDGPTVTAGKLTQDEAGNLDEARKAIADFCAAGGKGPAPVGSVAIIESLVSIDPAAVGPQGTVGEIAKSAAGDLRGCGERKLAKRINAALKAAA